MTTSQALIIIARFLQGLEWWAAGVGVCWLVGVLYIAGHAVYDHLPSTRRREHARMLADRERMKALVERYMGRRNP